MMFLARSNVVSRTDLPPDHPASIPSDVSSVCRPATFAWSFSSCSSPNICGASPPTANRRKVTRPLKKPMLVILVVSVPHSRLGMSAVSGGRPYSRASTRVAACGRLPVPNGTISPTATTRFVSAWACATAMSAEGGFEGTVSAEMTSITTPDRRHPPVRGVVLPGSRPASSGPLLAPW